MDLLDKYDELVWDGKVRYARDIETCDDCPLSGNDCPRSVIGTSRGYREPPCCSWDQDTLVFEGMYSNDY